MISTLVDLPIPHYLPAAWYWIVGDDGDRVFSSGAGAFVALTDAAYQTWLAAGHRPTRIDSEGSLADVLYQALGRRMTALPPPLIDPISDRQLFQQLALAGEITHDEALSAVKTGALPAVLQAMVTHLPDDQQFAAQMMLCGATQMWRHHPMTLAFAQARGWGEAQLDAFWRSAGAL